MRRKVVSPPGWGSTRTGRSASLQIQEEDFKGIASLFMMDKGGESLTIKYANHRVPIYGDGFSWLRQIPSEEHNVVTTMFDSDGAILQWIIDICLRSGVDTDGLCWWDDLYLDISVLPNGDTFVMDEEELDEARDSGVIPEQHHALAWTETERLLDLINSDRYGPIGNAVIYRDRLLLMLS